MYISCHNYLLYSDDCISPQMELNAPGSGNVPAGGMTDSEWGVM